MNAPKARGWSQTGHAAQIQRTDGNRLAIVSTIGEGTAAAWGFTVWQEGHCLAGRCHWTWIAERACLEADAWLAKHPETETD